MSFNLIQKIRNKIRVQSDNHILLGKKIKMSGCKIIIKGKNNTLEIQDSVRLRDTWIEIIGEGCKIKIGTDTKIGHGSYLSAREKGINLSIGNNCSFSRNAKVMTSDGHKILQEGVRINHDKDICIEDSVWIADNVTILKGVTIGHGSAIGINSTLTKNIPPRCVAVGNPCRVIRENITKAD